jgi:hypothetical protein
MGKETSLNALLALRPADVDYFVDVPQKISARIIWCVFQHGLTERPPLVVFQHGAA